MTDLDLDAIEARANAATDGPWFWRNTQGRSGDVYLQGARTRIVMAFKRMGMNGAQPMFRGLDGLLYESADVNINQFPDAEFIAYARTDVPALVALVRAKESWIDGAKVDMAALEEAAAKATTWHMEALDDLAACVAERDEARVERDRYRAAFERANAAVSACESWIEGAKVDLDGYDEAAAERDDWRRRYEALRDGVTGLCEQADRSHDEYLRGLILDRFIVPSNVTVSRIRAVVARVEGDES